MKKALKILLFYFLLMLLGVGVGTVLYTLYLQILNSVTGPSIDFFDIKIFLKALFYVIPCMCIIICPVLTFTHIKTREGAYQLIVYIFVAILNWGLVLPLALHFGDYFESTAVEEASLSGKYFREVENNIYYFAEDLSDDYKSTAIIMNKDFGGNVTVTKMYDSSADRIYDGAAPYRDILIKNSFDHGNIREFINLGYILENAKENLFAGWNFWLAFLSLGLILSSLYGVSNIFKWKLINGVSVIVMTLLIIFVNSYCLINPAIASVIQRVNDTGFFSFLAKYIDEPFIVLMNFIFGLLFIVIGIIKFCVDRKNG